MICMPTRNSSAGPSNILDLVLTNEAYNIEHIDLLKRDIALFPKDHLLIHFEFSLKAKRIKNKNRLVYNYKRTDFNGLRNTLRKIPFDCILTNDSIGKDWKIWNDLFLGAVGLHVPKSKIRDINSPPWIDGEVINLLHRTDSKRRKAKKTSFSDIWEIFRKLRTEAIKLIRPKHDEYKKIIADSFKEKPQAFLVLHMHQD